MVIVEFRRPRRDDSGYAIGSYVVTRVRADGEHLDIEGEERDLNLDQRVLSLRDGRSITYRDNAEEWLRSLVATYRSPYLWAEIVEDTEPLGTVQTAPVAVEEPVVTAEPLVR